MLITSLMREDKKLSIKIAKVHLLRWRIEEYYRFKKVQYGFEDFRVPSMNSIRTLNMLVTVMIGYMAMISEKRQAGSIMANDLMATLMRVYPEKSNKKKLFVFYAVADGMYTIFKRAGTGISAFIEQRLQSNQLSFFIMVSGLLFSLLSLKKMGKLKKEHLDSKRNCCYSIGKLVVPIYQWSLQKLQQTKYK